MGTINPSGKVRTVHIVVHYPNHPTALFSVSQYDGWDRLGIILARLEALSDLRVHLCILTPLAAGYIPNNGGHSVSVEQREELGRLVGAKLGNHLDVNEILEVSVMER
jgi:hypothetical protein